MHFTDGVVHGAHACNHIVQLFDTIQTRARTIGRYVADGLAAGDTVVVVAQPQHWKPIAERIAALGHDVNRAIQEERLTMLNAGAILKQFMVGASPDWMLYRQVVGSLMRRLSDKHRPLRIYGEMVDLLAADHNFSGAQRLEEFWNLLGVEIPFTLFCGYASSHFATHQSASALELVCRSHSEVRSDPADALGTWLLSTNGQRTPRVIN